MLYACATVTYWDTSYCPLELLYAEAFRHFVTCGHTLYVLLCRLPTTTNGSVPSLMLTPQPDSSRSY